MTDGTWKGARYIILAIVPLRKMWVLNPRNEAEGVAYGGWGETKVSRSTINKIG